MKSPKQSSMRIALSLVGLLTVFVACDKKTRADSYRELSLKEREVLGLGVVPQVEKASPVAEQCFAELCGGVQQSAMSQGLSSADAEAKAIEKMVQEKFQVERERDELIFSRVKPESLKSLRLESQAGDMFFGVYTVMQISEVSPFLIRNLKTGRIEIHRENYLKEHKADELRFTPEMMDVIDTYLQGNWMEINISGVELWDALRMGMGKNIDLKVKIKEITERTIEIRKKALEAVGGKLGALLNAQKKALAMQELTSSEGKDLIGDFAQAELFAQLLDGDLKGIFKKSQFFGSSLHQALLRVPLAKLKAQADRDQVAGSGQCFENLKTSLQGSVPSEKVPPFIAKVAELKAQSLKELSVLIKDPEKRKAVSDRLKKVTFKLADDRSQMLQAIQGFLSDEIAITRSFNSEAGNDLTRLQLAYLSRAGRVLQAERKAGATDKKQCDGFPVDRASDFALSSMNKITVSPLAMRSPHAGLGILAHELGHIVFAGIIGPQGELELRGPQPNITDPVLSCELQRVKGAHRLLNESFSDSFSAHVMRRLSRDHENSESNFACSLLKGTRQSELRLVDPMGQDVHPEMFFRANSWQKIFQGRLPLVCEENLRSSEFSELSACW